MPAPLSDSLLREALFLLEKHGSATKAAPYATKENGCGFGVSESSMRNRVREARTKLGQPAPAAAESQADLSTHEKRVEASRVEVLRADLKHARHTIAQLQRDAEWDRQVWEELTGFTHRPIVTPDWMRVPSAPGSPGTPIAMWSDWHWGEVVLGPEVRGLNQFNREISHARLHTLVTKTIELCFDHRKSPDASRIIVCLGGDMISGIIHEELQDTNHEYLMETLYDLTDKLHWALSELLKVFKHVAVYCVVGNHGRMGKKPRYKGKVKTSYEWGLYKNLQVLFKSNPDIVFNIPDSADIPFSVNGVDFLLTHGDTLGVKGGDGIIGAVGPIIRGKTKIKGAEARVNRHFGVLLIGHWHQWMPLAHNGVVVNGSMKGFDEFAMLAIRAEFQLPIQGLLFAHPTYGITEQLAVFLEKEKNT